MNLLKEIIRALWHQDFAALADPWVVYGVIFTTLFLENGLLPAFFLPGDSSLLLLSGTMVAKGVMAFFPTLIILSAAAGFGCGFSYLQGRWLSDTRIVRSWLLHLPTHYHLRTYTMFSCHRLTTLLIGYFGFCAHAAANDGRHFRPQQYPFSAVQLVKRANLGHRAG